MTDTAFLRDGATPTGFRVVDVTPKHHAVCRFAVVADYPWGGTAIAPDCQWEHANDIARILGIALGVPYTQARNPYAD